MVRGGEARVPTTRNMKGGGGGKKAAEEKEKTARKERSRRGRGS